MSSPSLAERYQAIHRLGQDCRVTCSRNMLEYFGHRHTYSTIQGLSSCFFFVYRKTDTARARLLFPEGDLARHFWPVSGQRLEVMENISCLFNAVLVTRESQSPARALEAIRPYLAEGIPVMVAICRELLLEHLGIEIDRRGLPEGLAFGGHWIVVAGIDDRRRVAQVFETDRREVIELPLDLLARLRTHGDDQEHFMMKSRNRWAVMVPPDEAPSFPSLVYTALSKVVHNMTCPILARDEVGLPALEAFCREVPDWCERQDLPREKLTATVYFMWMNSELMMGGGFGRRSFGMFLKNCGRVLESPRLITAAQHYGEAGRLWRRLVQRLAIRIFQSSGTLTFRDPEITDLLPPLLAEERAGLSEVEAFVDGFVRQGMVAA